MKKKNVYRQLILVISLLLFCAIGKYAIAFEQNNKKNTLSMKSTTVSCPTGKKQMNVVYNINGTKAQGILAIVYDNTKSIIDTSFVKISFKNDDRILTRGFKTEHSYTKVIRYNRIDNVGNKQVSVGDNIPLGKATIEVSSPGYQTFKGEFVTKPGITMIAVRLDKERE